MDSEDKDYYAQQMRRQLFEVQKLQGEKLAALEREIGEFKVKFGLVMFFGSTGTTLALHFLFKLIWK